MKAAAKAKAKLPSTQVAELTSEQRAILDEFVQVRSAWKSWQPAVNPHSARYEELKATILGWFEKKPADVAYIAEGTTHKIPITMRENKRTVVKVLQLVRKLGLKWVAENCTPTLSAIEKSKLSPEQRKQFITEAREGPRSIGEPVLIAVPAVTKTAA